jgi:hypothetical protein
MDWSDVLYFLALARLGSVRAAGASLGVSHSTVARRVEALECRLASRLFDRNARFRATRVRVAAAIEKHLAWFQGDWCTDAPVGPEFAPWHAAESPVG